MAASHRIIRYRLIRKRSPLRVRYTQADAGGERTGSLARTSYPQCRSDSIHLRTSSCAEDTTASRENTSSLSSSICLYISYSRGRAFTNYRSRFWRREKSGSLARPSYPQCRSGLSQSGTSSCTAASQGQGKIKPLRAPAGVRITPDAVDLVTAVENQAYHRTAVETAAAVGAAEAATRAAEVSRVGELVAAAVAPRPRSPGEVCAGCARATSITSVTAPNRSSRDVARGATT